MTLPLEAQELAPSSLGTIALLLRRPAFLAFLGSAIGTLTGMWLLETALQWTLLTSSGSSGLVGLLYVGIYVPIVVLAVPIGIVIDRYGAKPLMVASQAIWCSLMLAGAILSHFGWMNVPVAILLAAVDGLCTGMWSVPAQVVLGRVVRKELMASAIGLGLLQFSAGRLIAGSLAAVTLPLGPTAALLLGAISVVIGMTAGLRVRENRSLERRAIALRWPAEVGQALNWLIHNPPVVSLVALGGFTALFTLSYIVVLPSVSRSMLHSGATGLGLMGTSAGVGLTVAAFAADPLGRFLGRGATVCWAVAVASASIALLGLSVSLVLSLILVGIIAGGLGVYGATNNSLLQALSTPDMRGRVLAVFGLVVWVIFPIASFATGSLVDRLGARFVLLAMGGLTFGSVVFLLFAYRPLAKLDVGRSGLARLRTPPMSV